MPFDKIIAILFKKQLQKYFLYAIMLLEIADVMELADVTDSKSVGGNTVWVRLPPSAPTICRMSLGTSGSFIRLTASVITL